MALLPVITGLLGGFAAAASSNKNKTNNSSSSGTSSSTSGSTSSSGTSSGSSYTTPWDKHGDLGELILNAATDEEARSWATIRQQKEDYMKENGLWDPSWKTTAELYPALNQQIPQLPNMNLDAYLSGSQSYLNQMQQQNQQYLNNMKAIQKQNANASYDELARQAYIQKVANEINAPKLMAMTGQTGGLAETTAVAPTVAYGNAISDIGTSRAQTLSQIDLASDEQALQIAMDYADKMIAQANADRNFAYNAYRDQMGDYQYNQNFNYQTGRDSILDDRYDNEWAYNTAQQEKQDAYNRAMDLIANGVLPSDDLLTSAGISKTDAQALVTKVNTAQTTTSGGSYRGSLSTEKPYEFSPYTEALLAMAQTEEGFDLQTALDSALAQGLITKQDRDAALIYSGGYAVNGPAGESDDVLSAYGKSMYEQLIYQRDEGVLTEQMIQDYLQKGITSGNLTMEEAEYILGKLGF